MLEFKACLLVLQIYKTVHYPFHLNLTILHSERRYNGVTHMITHTIEFTFFSDISRDVCSDRITMP